MELEKFYYDNKIVKLFTYATIFWGVIGMLGGVFIATQMVLPSANFNMAALTFGRWRPVHTNAVIFAFVGNGFFAGYYYSLQRLLKTGMASNWMTKVHFWGWQAIIAVGAASLLAGFTSGKEYAELEWPVDIAITVIWVIFGWNMMWTILKRRVKHIYVAIWFYIATFVTVAVLHIVNSMEIPWSLFKSYPVFAGVQDALVQWWYGHNAVAFFLTTPYLGLMYYFMPKAANRPIYSYKLSIIHFWSLIFLYIWAGPHHLLYQAIPNWAQSLGTVFSIMLIAPSWGGMINGLLTLRGAWDRVREDPVLKFFVVAITAYGMVTFEGPMLALKNINAISHFTNWTIAHVHVGTLAWNGFLTFGMIYWLVPRLFKTELYSKKLANLHFWLGTLAILFYVLPLYWASWAEASMWKQFNDAGSLVYPNFLEIVTQIMPMYNMRLFGGSLYFTGVCILVYNIYKTTKIGSFVEMEAAEAPPIAKEGRRQLGESFHSSIERRPIQFMILAIIAILIGGIVEIVPAYLVKSNVPTIAAVKPYTPLELHGRDIYVAEGCYTCHSQMIRPFRSETERYGEYSKAGEFVYDHPFQWGSKRIGPDLAREGVKSGPLYKPNSWHYNHFMDPQKINAQSIMPKYPWLAEDEIDIESTPAKIRVMQYLGVPYPEGYAEKAGDDVKAQAETIAAGLRADGIDITASKKVIALIAYIQRMGTDVGDSK